MPEMVSGIHSCNIFCHPLLEYTANYMKLLSDNNVQYTQTLY